MWLTPDNNHELLWDYSMCADTSRGAAIRELISRALKGPLAPAQQEVYFFLPSFEGPFTNKFKRLFQFAISINNF